MIPQRLGHLAAPELARWRHSARKSEQEPCQDLSRSLLQIREKAHFQGLLVDIGIDQITREIVVTLQYTLNQDKKASTHLPG